MHTLIWNVISLQQNSNTSFLFNYFMYFYKNVRCCYNFSFDITYKIPHQQPTLHLEYSLLLRHTFQKMYVLLINWDYLWWENSLVLPEFQ